MLQAGVFQIGLQTRGDQTQAALKVVRDTLGDFVAHGPSAQELEEAKNNLIGGFPMRIDSNAKIHEYLATIGFYDLPLTYLDEFVDNIRKVTVADIRAAFERHVQPGRMVTVVVGGGVGAAAVQ
jgi:zinc protease